MLNEYRQRFSDYYTELYRERYLFKSGRKERLDSAHIFSEYSDLFTLSVVDDLRARLEETSDHRENERRSLKLLIAFALEGNLALRVREIDAEIERTEAAAEIDWEGDKVGFEQSAELLKNQPDALRLRELYARRAEVIKGMQDLWAERFEKLSQGARELKYESALAMRRELREVDFQKLATEATIILSKTESQYVSVLSPLLIREVNVSIDEATPADLCFQQNFTRFDRFFPPERMIEIYHELFAGLGFKAENQFNVEIDTETRPRKQKHAFCSPIRVPEEIKLTVNLNGGQENYRGFLRESGRTQNYAWCSLNLYPEFRIGGDAAVPLAWGMLLENLLLDEHWLLGTVGFVGNTEFRHTLAFFKLMSARRQAAKLNYEVEFHAGKLSSNAGARYAELLQDALRVRYDETEHLRDLSDSFASSGFLRACAFESQLREYLKTEFGRRWWISPKAGEMLIDLWNTGQRYRLEELASMIGLGDLDFEWLVAELLNQIEN